MQSNGEIPKKLQDTPKEVLKTEKTPKQTSPKFTIMKKQSVPCYIANGGVHNIVNVPLGQFTRYQLKQLIRELLKTGKTLETFVAAKATTKTIKLLEGLLKILDLNLKPKSSREAAVHLLTEYEENLKPAARRQGKIEVENLVSFSISCGLITLCYMVGAFLQYLETH